MTRQVEELTRPIRTAAILGGTILLWLAACLTARAAETPGPTATPAAERHEVDRGFDGKGFAYTSTLLADRPAYRVLELRYPSPLTTPIPQNNTIPAEYYLPKRAEGSAVRRPAVICLHILNGNFELERLTCATLATRGIPAILFKLPYYGERATPNGHRDLGSDAGLFAEAFRQGVLDVRRTVDVLAARPEVDPAHIGVIGISMGGILAGTAAAQEPRIDRTVMVLAGGDIPSIIGHARETADLREMLAGLSGPERLSVEAAIAAVDPLSHAAALEPRAKAGRVLMINAAEDEVIPKSCTQKLARALGIEPNIRWLPELGHYTALAALPQILQEAGDFFAKELPDGCAPRVPPAAAQTPLRTIVAMLLQAQQMIANEPPKGRCHFADFDLNVRLPNGDEHQGRLRWVRGEGYRFRLETRLPEIGTLMLGQGEYPWMVGSKDVAFCGRLAEETKADDPLKHIPPERWTKLKMAAGALAGIALVPELLEQWVTAEDVRSDNTDRVIRLTRKDRPADSVEFVLASDGAPRIIRFDVDGARGKIQLRAWQLSAPALEGLFAPPAAAKTQDVDAADLYRMYSAMLQFALEKLP